LYRPETARNLAMANISRVSSAHEVTRVNFQGGEFLTREKTYDGRPTGVAAGAGSINMRVG